MTDQTPVCDVAPLQSAQRGKRWHKKAFRYYCFGLTSKELAKLFDVSFRTVQGLMSRENWKQRRAEHLQAQQSAAETAEEQRITAKRIR